MAAGSGDFDADGLWLHGEDDALFPDDEFSELLNKPTLSIAAAVDAKIAAASDDEPTADMLAKRTVTGQVKAADPVEDDDVLTLGAGNAAYQPLDSDLTAIAALTSTAFGRALLELADAAAGRTAFGAAPAATSRQVTLSNGGTENVAATDDVIVFIGSTAATFSVNFPASPANGKRIVLKFLAQVTTPTFTASGGATVESVLSTGPGASITFAYDSTSNLWRVVNYIPGYTSTVVTRNSSSAFTTLTYTSAATANTIALRDGSGRMAAASPAASGDVATKGYVDPTTGTVAPSSTPTRIGAMYIDTAAAKVYVAIGTASSADWVALN